MPDTPLARPHPLDRRAPHRPVVPILASAFALVVGLGGCGESGAASADSRQTVSPEMEDLYRVGTVEGTGWEAFAQLRSVAFDERGRLYILDVGQHHVVVLDETGAFLHTIGTRGEGPEELRQPLTMTVLGNGEIAIYDMGHQSFLVFTPEGAFLRSIRAGFEEGIPGPRIWPHGPSGVVSVSQGIVMMRGGGGPPAPPTTAPIRRFELGGNGGAEVLHEAWIPTREGAQAGVRMQGGGGGVRFQAPSVRAFEPRVHLAALPDGRMVVADTSSYRLRYLSATGGEEALVERAEVRPQPVGEPERRAERERRLQELDEGGGPQISISISGPGGPTAVDPGAIREGLRTGIEEMEFWHEIPVITRMAADPSGRLWVARSGGVEEPGPIDLFSSDGVHLGSLGVEHGPIPDAFGPGGLAAWIETDELDVPYVRVRRVSGLPQP